MDFHVGEVSTSLPQGKVFFSASRLLSTSASAAHFENKWGQELQGWVLEIRRDSIQFAHDLAERCRCLSLHGDQRTVFEYLLFLILKRDAVDDIYGKL